MLGTSGSGSVHETANPQRGNEARGLFHLSLLGPFRLADAEGRPLDIASRKNKLLIAILACATGRRMSRDGLAGMLWADTGEEQARNSLRQALAVLRKDLKGQDAAFFSALDSSVALQGANIVLDVDEFTAGFRENTCESLARAVALWRGGFLADVNGGGNGLEQWLTEQREHYNNLHIAAMDRLVPLLAGEARIDMARRLIAADPLREASHRHLMMAHLADGERALALRHYENMRKLLREELDVAPSPETQALRNRIAASGSTAPAPAPAPAVAAPPAPLPPAPPAPEPAAAVPQSISIAPPRPARSYAFAAGLALGLAALAVWAFKPAPPPPLETPAIAVLPIESLSDDPKDARLAEGLTVDTITDLSRFWDLKVIAKDSTDAYKGKSVDIREIGRDLHVTHVLKGTLQRDRDDVRLTAQLIDAATGLTLWSDRYERRSGEIFAIQSDIADHIANSLGGKEGKVGQSVLASARRKLPADLGAYEIYLLAQETMHSDVSDAHMREGQQLLQQAIAKDPTLARAYVKYAAADAWRYTYEGGVAALLQEMLAYARQAVSLDPMDADARSILGYALTLSGKAAEGEAQFDAALRLNPTAFDILTNYSCMAHNFGKAERGAEATDRAIAINPGYPNWAIPCLRLAVFMVGRYADAVRIQSRQAESDWNSDGYVVMAGSLAKLGRSEEARALAARGVARFPGLLSIERFALNRGWSAGTAKVLVEHMRLAGFPACATDAELSQTAKPVRLPECGH